MVVSRVRADTNYLKREYVRTLGKWNAADEIALR
jgi:hypothetical protein